MFRVRFRLPLTLLVGLTLVLPLTPLARTPSAEAVWNNEAFEPQNYYSYGGSKDGVFWLAYAGPGFDVGSDRCDWNDAVFFIRVNRSYARSDWKFFSSNGRYQRTPSGRPIYGHDLGGTNAHICVGASEFSRFTYPNTYWSAGGVQAYVYTWRR